MYVARRVYTRELKLAVIRELENGRRLPEVARQLEVSPKTIEAWQTTWRKRGELAFPGHGQRALITPLTEMQRMAELERKIGQLTVENDLLKKALEHLKARQMPAVVSGEAACLKKFGRRPNKGKPKR